VKTIVVLRHHEEDHVGLIGEAFTALGYECRTSLVRSPEDLPTLEGASAVVVLGSASSTYDVEVRRGWFDAELDWMRDATRRNVPILGICFGAQALCTLAGGVVTRAPREEIGWFNVTSHSPALPSGPWFEYHFDHCSLPSTVDVLAETALAVQAFQWGRNLGVQFHPEVDAAQLADWFDADDALRATSYDTAVFLERARHEDDLLRQNASSLVDLFLGIAELH